MRTTVRLDDFRIVVADGSRANDDVRVSDVLRCMSFKDLDTHLLQAVGDVRAFQIGARDAKAEIDEHLGDAGHADAADAYEMDVLNATKHFLATKRHINTKNIFLFTRVKLVA